MPHSRYGVVETPLFYFVKYPVNSKPKQRELLHQVDGLNQYTHESIKRDFLSAYEYRIYSKSDGPRADVVYGPIGLCEHANNTLLKDNTFFKIRKSKIMDICDVRMVDKDLLRDIKHNIKAITNVPFKGTVYYDIYYDIYFSNSSNLIIQKLVQFNDDMCSSVGRIHLMFNVTENKTIFKHDKSEYAIDNNIQPTLVHCINELLEVCSEKQIIFSEYRHWITGKPGHGMFLVFRKDQEEETKYAVELYNPNGSGDLKYYSLSVYHLVTEYNSNSEAKYSLHYTGSVWDNLVETNRHIAIAFKNLNQAEIFLTNQVLAWSLVYILLLLIILNPSNK